MLLIILFVLAFGKSSGSAVVGERHLHGAHGHRGIGRRHGIQGHIPPSPQTCFALSDSAC